MGVENVDAVWLCNWIHTLSIYTVSRERVFSARGEMYHNQENYYRLLWRVNQESAVSRQGVSCRMPNPHATKRQLVLPWFFVSHGGRSSTPVKHS